MMTKIHVLPSDTGKSVIKSTPRCDQGRLGGCDDGGDEVQVLVIRYFHYG